MSNILNDLISFINDDVPSNSKSIQISNGSYNSVILFKLLDLNTIESIVIGDNCFENVNEFVLNGLNHLKSIKIGINSFTLLKNSDKWDSNKANNRSRSFSILNCIELESIEIGRYSFSDYGGGFELRNLPKLSTIKIGEIGTDSSNFSYSSFAIRGMIDMILLMNRSSTFEFHYIRK